ncbi:MAG: hypothetical protein CL840_02315 [Crocinitomicaceae bacterium]|nr:hypothetical protein [Crocinitomicaceae bacterium]|tara:strand:- start:9692 stop:10522 length:831 start_codon:yes stop_codon:yes gene_type:complete
MLRIILIGIWLWAGIMNSFAQDIMYRKDGGKVLCKVEEVLIKEIKYRKYDNLNGPLYSVTKREILVIVYENGTYEYPNLEPNESTDQKPRSEFETEVNSTTEESLAKDDFSRNLFSINPLNLIHGNINIAYERLFSEGKVGLRLPLKIGFDNKNFKDYIGPSAVNQKVTGSVELGLMVYPFGQQDITYVGGIGIEVGEQYNQQSYSVYAPSGYNVYIYNYDVATYGTMYFYNGFRVNPNRHFNMSFLVGMGPKRYFNTKKVVEFGMNLSFNLGFAF